MYYQGGIPKTLLNNKASVSMSSSKISKDKLNNAKSQWMSKRGI